MPIKEPTFMGKRPKRVSPEETGVIRKPAAEVTVALVYPNRYSLGMSSLGFQAVYALINRLPGVSCERAFYPEPDSSEKTGIRTLETRRRLSDVDVIAFSVSFENDYPNLLSILQRARLPLLSTERSFPHPWVVAGGVAAFLNPEPLALFMDCLFIGEAEEIVPPFFDCLSDSGPRAQKDRKTFLLRLAREVPGAYVPRFYTPAYRRDGTLRSFLPNADVPEKIQRVYCKDLSVQPAKSAIVGPETTFGRAFLMEVSRGCPHGCRFCAAGFVYRPPRFQSPASLAASVGDARALTDRVGLVGGAVADHPEIDTVCSRILAHGMTAGFSSLRADALSPPVFALLKESKTKTATLAPDAGSERMRIVINKHLTENRILEAVQALVENEILNLKLYFMVGLPTETAEDVEAIIALCRRIKHRFLKASRPKGRMGTITVSLNSFVPKPVTPFQWAPMDTVGVLKEKIKKVKTGLGNVSNVRIHADVPRWALIQGLLSLGDRRVGEILLAVHQNQGNWPRTLKTASANPGFYVHREKDLDERLPWDFVDHGIQKAFLKKEFKRAMEGKPSPPCPIESCRACGVC